MGEKAQFVEPQICSFHERVSMLLPYFFFFFTISINSEGVGINLWFPEIGLPFMVNVYRFPFVAPFCFLSEKQWNVTVQYVSAHRENFNFIFITVR